MRWFHSYGPLNTKLHYYAPRKNLIDKAYMQLIGENPTESGNYITVWAPRQCGKTWIMQEIVEKIKQIGQYEVGIISMESLKEEKEEKKALDIPKLLRRYETYLKKNREWLLKNAPRRSDLRIFEAVYHFNLYSYLKQLLGAEGGDVFPEFPTGNGKIDLIINYNNNQYGLEVKSYTTRGNYRQSLIRAAQYGKQLGINEIFPVFFVDAIDEENRARYEKNYPDEATGVMVVPIFVETGE